MRLYLDCHRTTQGTGGEVVIILQHLVQEMPLLGLFFPPSSCLTTLATRAPSRVFCHAVTVYAHYGAPFSCGWDFKLCFAVGKGLSLEGPMARVWMAGGPANAIVVETNSQGPRPREGT